MAAVHNVAEAFFPLDKELDLLPGLYTPQLQEIMTRLGAKLPYEQAKDEIERLCHTRISEPTIRRQTMRNGEASEALAKAEAKRIEKEAPSPPTKPNTLLISVDGAFVALTSGEWREVKSLIVGEFGTIRNHQGQESVKTSDLSYFSRSYRARDFEFYALTEIHRRGVAQANLVVMPSDGSEWIQNFADYHCPQAIRILDFPHAQGYLADVGKAVYGEGTEAFQTWFRQASQMLKHRPPAETLAYLDQLRQTTTQADVLKGIDCSLAYLRKREGALNYSHFVAQGYPIGSGAVESGHKVVMQCRMKQAGMRWAERHVDPLLCLRNLIGNQRWSEGWEQIRQYRQQQKQPAPKRRTPDMPSLPIANQPVQSSPREAPPPVTKPETSSSPKPYRPSANHPWRQPFAKQKKGSLFNPSHPKK